MNNFFVSIFEAIFSILLCNLDYFVLYSPSKFYTLFYYYFKHIEVILINLFCMIFFVISGLKILLNVYIYEKERITIKKYSDWSKLWLIKVPINRIILIKKKRTNTRLDASFPSKVNWEVLYKVYWLEGNRRIQFRGLYPLEGKIYPSSIIPKQ